MYGLTVRWSLHGRTVDVAEQLRDHALRLAAEPVDGTTDLHQTLWTLREGGAFSTTYVWRTAEARAAFVGQLRAQGSPVNAIVGSSADAFEEFEVIAIAPGQQSER